MKVVYHRSAARDVRQILDHYDSEAGPQLADRFFKDLLGTISKALLNPNRFPPVDEYLRRANLQNFPYHFLYEAKHCIESLAYKMGLQNGSHKTPIVIIFLGTSHRYIPISQQ